MDAFFLESVDGRQHVEQFGILAEFGKPVFIDKPLACSAADARAIIDISRSKGVPIMSASSVRYAAGLRGLVAEGAEVQSCEAFCVMPMYEDYPAYFWYGVHSVDLLFAYMGKGCESVQTLHRDDVDLLVGRWAGGRLGTARGPRFPLKGFGCTVYADGTVAHAVATMDPPPHYLMLKEVMEFFRTGQEPIDPEETCEVMAFLEAAGESLERGGAVVPIAR